MTVIAANLPSALLPWPRGPSTSAAGQGLESVLQHTWPYPSWVTLLIMILAAAWVVIFYLRENVRGSRTMRVGLILLRLALVCLVILTMYGFVLRPYRTDRPDVVVLLDDSESMSRIDPDQQDKLRQGAAQRISAAGLADTRRINQAKTVLRENDSQLLRRLNEKYRLKVYRISQPEPIPWQTVSGLATAVKEMPAQFPASPLGARLRQVLGQQHDRPTVAVIVLTDGITTQGRTLGDVAGDARSKSVPLYLVGLGSNQPARDIQVHDLLADDTVYVGDVVAFAVSITANGFEGQQVRVRLRRLGNPQVLAETDMQLGKDGQSERVTLRYRPPRQGTFDYEVRVDPLPGETRSDNNAVRQRVTVRDETVRVLLLQAYPSYEFRFLKNLLGRNTMDQQKATRGPIQLTTVLQQADQRYAETDSTAIGGVPVQLDGLRDYDVILFGDVDPVLLGRSAMRNLHQFVTEWGRSMVFLSGPHYTPLAYRGTLLEPLFPIDLDSAEAPSPDQPITQPYVMQPTPLGEICPSMQLADPPDDNLKTWQSLPGLYWLLHAPQVKPGVRVLAQHPRLTNDQGQKLPVICLQYVGAGKVLLHATDETWRWRWRYGDLWFGRYWRQTIRMLSRDKLSGDWRAWLTTDRQQYRRGEPVSLRLRFFDDRQAPAADDGVTVLLRREGGPGRRVRLHRDSIQRGIFHAMLQDLAVGRHQVTVITPAADGGGPQCQFTVTAPDSEMARVAADLTDLKRAASRSGGRCYTFQSSERLADELPQEGPVRVEPLPAVPVWNVWAVALALVALPLTEWLLRRRAGLL